MTNEKFEKITTYIENDSEYVIIYYKEGWKTPYTTFHYAAINTEYINADGTLNRTLNGIDMFVSESVKETINKVHDKESVTRIMKEEGLSVEEATIKYFKSVLERMEK